MNSRNHAKQDNPKEDPDEDLDLQDLSTGLFTEYDPKQKRIRLKEKSSPYVVFLLLLLICVFVNGFLIILINQYYIPLYKLKAYHYRDMLMCFVFVSIGLGLLIATLKAFRNLFR